MRLDAARHGVDQRGLGAQGREDLPGEAGALAGVVGKAATVLRANGSSTLLAAAAAGLGVALLPCFLADPAGLVRVIPELRSREIWLTVHGEVRGSARTRAGMAFLGEALRDAAPVLRGDAGARMGS
jgi:DNA-binding transcriptional LysR family regulator